MISKPTVKLLHLITQGIVVILGGIALKAVFAYQNANGWANAHMIHSWVGFTTFLMFGLQVSAVSKDLQKYVSKVCIIKLSIVIITYTL